MSERPQLTKQLQQQGMTTPDLYVGYESIAEIEEENYDKDTEVIVPSAFPGLSSPMHLYYAGSLPQLRSLFKETLILMLQEAAKSVCRVYAMYTKTKDCEFDFEYPNYRINCGTAFSISDRFLVTCRHIVEEQLCFVHEGQMHCTEECKPLFLRKVFITFNDDARRSVDDLENIWGFHEVLVRYPSERRSKSTDFCFLHLVDYSSQSYLLPSFEEKVSPYALVSYPGIIGQETYEKKYHSPISYADLKRTTGGFHRKVVSLSRELNLDENDLLVHYCSALRGSSGAPLINAEGKFIGIQIGGSPERSGNIAIDTRASYFKEQYQSVLNIID